MITISLCMIVKDEEETIERCLDCVEGIADEIIIVDTGSTDNTKNIVRKYTNKIYDFKWIQDFSVARNFSFSKATMEYILWLDADDIIIEEDRKRFKWVKANLTPNIDIVMMKYNMGFKGKDGVACTYYRERLLRREKNYIWHNPIHEYIKLTGKIVNSDVCITHKRLKHRQTDRNIKIFENMMSNGRILSDRDIFYYARELYYNKRYEEAIEFYDKFLDSENGLISNYIDACIDMHKCFKLKEDTKNALKALLRSFEHALPRAEICCHIGYLYKEQKKYQEAIYWFNLATELEKPKISWGSVIHDFWDFIPYMELCICYTQTEKIEKALASVRAAEKYKPEHPAVIKNINVLENYLKNKKAINA